MTPDGWRNLAVKDLADIVSGVGFPRKHQGSQVGKIPFFKVSDMNTQGNERGLRVAANTVDRALLDSLKGKLHPPGTVVFPKVGAALLTNKRRRLVVPSCFDNNVMGLVATGCDPDYLYLLMQAVDFADHVQSGAIPSINGSTVGGIRVLVPPLPEQRKIAAILSSVDDAIEKTQAVIDQVQVVKRGLMQELLTRGLPGRHTRFKQTEIGTVPEAWARVSLAEVVDLRLSSVDKKIVPGEEKVRLCNYSDVYNNTVIRSDMVFMEGTATEREIRKCRLEVGDVIITKDSETPDDIGVPAVVREQVVDLICGYHLAILRPLKSALDGEYLHYALCTSSAKRQFRMYANGITRFGLRAGDIGRVGMPLPSLPEQRKIATILSSMDDSMERSQASLSELQYLKSGLMSVLLTGELRVTPDNKAA